MSALRGASSSAQVATSQAVALLRLFCFAPLRLCVKAVAVGCSTSTSAPRERATDATADVPRVANRVATCAVRMEIPQVAFDG
jgi:hypothetical protein